MRHYIRVQLKEGCTFVLDDFPKWAIYFREKPEHMVFEDVFEHNRHEAVDGSWNHNAAENAVAWSEIRKSFEE